MLELHTKHAISGVILAGGKSSRMGQDKGLMKINDIALIQYTIRQIESQVTQLFINTNQNQQQYQRFLKPLISDLDPLQLGPLSGIYSAITSISSSWAFFCACDTPCIPIDIVDRLFLLAQSQQKHIAVVTTNNYLQPLVLLLHTSLANSLNHFLQSGGNKAQQWVLQQNPAILDCSDEDTKFINLNTKDQIIEFKNMLSNQKSHHEY